MFSFLADTDTDTNTTQKDENSADAVRLFFNLFDVKETGQDCNN